MSQCVAHLELNKLVNGCIHSRGFKNAAPPPNKQGYWQQNTVIKRCCWVSIDPYDRDLLNEKVLYFSALQSLEAQQRAMAPL